MKSFSLMALVASIVFGSAYTVQADVEDDGEESVEIVIRRKKKPSPPVITPPIVAPVVVAPTDAAKEPPPPPEPPAADAAEARRLVRYFCKAWKDKDYERLWWTMSSDYRKKVPLKKFTKLFTSDAEANGGLFDENILETSPTKDGNEGVKVELIFKFPKAQHRFVTAIAERQPGGQFRLVESPFIPLDLEDL